MTYFHVELFNEHSGVWNKVRSSFYAAVPRSFPSRYSAQLWIEENHPTRRKRGSRIVQAESATV